MTAVFERPAPSTSARLPNLLIAGVKKAGTTSLFDWLRQHPDICPSDVKATNYFSPLRHGVTQLPPLAVYADHFAHATSERYRLESSTTYFYGGRTIAEAVAQTLPDARIIVTLRDPVDRLWSDYHMKVRERSPALRHLTFPEYVERCRAAHAEGAVERRPGLTGFARGLYVADAQPWWELFGDRLRFVFLERWSVAPDRVLAEIYRWLGIALEPAANTTFRRRNENMDYRSRVTAAALRRTYRSTVRYVPAAKSIKPLLRRAHQRMNGRANPAVMSADVRAMLEEAYRPSNTELARMLRARGYRDLPDWLSGPGMEG